MIAARCFNSPEIEVRHPGNRVMMTVGRSTGPGAPGPPARGEESDQAEAIGAIMRPRSTRFFTPTLLSILALFSFSFFSPGRILGAAEGGDYLRFVPLGDDGGRLETAVVTFERPDGVRVS